MAEQLSAEQAGLESFADAQARSDTAKLQINAAIERRTAAQESLRDTQNRRASWSAQLAAGSELLAANGGTTEGLRGAQDILQSDLAKADSELARLDLEQREAQERRVAAQRAVATVQSRITAARNDLGLVLESQAEAMRRWESLGFEGPPAELTVARVRMAATEKHALCGRLSQRRDAALNGWTLWRSHDALHRVEAEERGELLPDETTEMRSEMLERHVQECQVEQRRVKEAFNLAIRLRNILKSKQQEFTNAVLSPFGERISAFEQVISPFQHQVGLAANQRADRTDFSIEVTPRRPIAGGGSTRNLQSWLSEGQISAMGVSMILGASTAYDWSRWRALLLDDPLQHTDLIHASAFLDVLRALIMELHYQVVISSHDLEEADFIERKCRRFRIPVQRCVLLGAGPKGVRWRASNNF